MKASSRLDWFERKGLFALVRLTSLMAVGVLSVALIFVVFHFWQTLMPASISVAPSEIQEVVSQPDGTGAKTSQTSSSVLGSLSIPSRVSRGLAGENKQIVEQWLNGIDTSHRQDFVDNMDTVIKYAEQNNLDVTRSVNTFHELWMRKAQETLSQQRENELVRVSTVGLLLAIFTLILILALVLVVLAIERNTRATRVPEQTSL
jgi:hypothetical protein